MLSLGATFLVFTLVSVFLMALLLFISYCVRPHRKRESARHTYECGMPAKGEHRGIGFQFINYAVLFLVFDIAAVYLFLYTVLAQPSSVVMVSFLLGLMTLVLIIIHATRRRKYIVS